MDADHASLASRISHATSSSPFDLWGNTGLYVGLGTFIVTILLESISMPCVCAIVAAPGGKMLYGQAWFYTAINSIVLGPPVYGIVAKWLVHDRTCNAGPVLCALHIFGRVVCLLFLHSFGYWYAHMTMHTSWLWWAHKFHHKFSSAVTPCVAMAVSPMEYMVAYMLPFVLGAVLLRPDGLALLLAVCVVSLSNLLGSLLTFGASFLRSVLNPLELPVLSSNFKLLWWPLLTATPNPQP